MKSGIIIFIGVCILLMIVGYMFFRSSADTTKIIKRIEDYGPLFTPPPAPPNVKQSVVPPIVATPQEKAFDRYW
jgi:hypothetical protein